MRKLTQDDFTIEDATGRRYPPRWVIWKTADTIGRTLVVLALLYAVGGIWQAFN